MTSFHILFPFLYQSNIITYIFCHFYIKGALSFVFVAVVSFIIQVMSLSNIVIITIIMIIVIIIIIIIIKMRHNRHTWLDSGDHILPPDIYFSTQAPPPPPTTFTSFSFWPIKKPFFLNHNISFVQGQPRSHHHHPLLLPTFLFQSQYFFCESSTTIIKPKENCLNVW